MQPTADPDELEMQLQWKRQRIHDNMSSPRLFVLLVGIVPLLLFTMLPVWASLRLLDEPIYMFLHQGWLPERTVALCSWSVVAYALAVMLFFRCGSRQGKDARAALAGQIIFTLICIILGMSLVLLSVPLRREVDATYTELFSNCQAGEHTRVLYEYSARLQALRRTPACMAEVSVELCEGYTASYPHVTILKQLESQFQCAGFCHVMSASAGANTTVPTVAYKAADPNALPTSVIKSGQWPPLVPADAGKVNHSAEAKLQGVPGARQLPLNVTAAGLGVFGTADKSRGEGDHGVAEGHASGRGSHHRPDHRSGSSIWGEMKSEIKRDVHGPAKPPPAGDIKPAGSLEAAAAAMKWSEEHQQHAETGHAETGHAETGHAEVGHAEAGHAETGGAHSLLAVAASSAPARAKSSRVRFHPRAGFVPVSPGGTVEENPFTKLGPGFPPPLFSNASAASTQKTNKVSCEGMAAWSLSSKALDAAGIFYWEGVMLLFAMAFGGLFKLIGNIFETCGCRPARKR